MPVTLRLSGQGSTLHYSAMPFSISPRRHCHGGLDDIHQNASVQRYIRQLVDEYGEVTKKLQYTFLSDSERKELNLRQTELLPVEKAFRCTVNAMKELEEITSLIQSKLCGSRLVLYYRLVSALYDNGVGRCCFLM